MSSRSTIIVLALCAAVSLRAAPPDGWPMFRGDPGLAGVYSGMLPPTLRLKWSFQAKDSIESTAAISEGTVYVASMDGNLYALDLQSGRAKWQYVAGAPIEESSPCVNDGAVYVGDLDGVVHAVDCVTGKKRWSFKAESEIKSSPNPYQGRIYIGCYDQRLYCLSARDGSVVWKQETQGPVHCTPAIAGGRVLVAGCDETFRAFDAASGKPLFKVALGAYTGASPATRDQMAYVGTFGNEVLAIDLQKRTVRWRYQHPSRNFPFYSTAAVSTDRIVVGGRDKMVHCLDRATGKAVWTFTTRARVDSSPIVADGRVFVGSSDGHVYGFELASGRKTWDFTAGAPVTASPAMGEECLVIGSQDGILYCFGR